MIDLNVSPRVAEVFGNQSTMTVPWCLLRAEQARSIEEVSRQCFDFPLAHERKKVALVLFPRSAQFSRAIEKLLRGRQLDEMLILDPENGSRKKCEIFLLRVAGQLGRIVQANVEEPSDGRVLQEREEYFS
jgi:hypothetical protein